MESQQSCAPLQKSSLPSPKDVRDSSHNQMSPESFQKHLHHENLQSIEPCASSQPGQLPPIEGQVSFPNQEHLQGNSMYDVSQHPQHQTDQAKLSVPKEGVSSSEEVVDVLPVSAVTQHIQEQLLPDVPPRTFPQLLAESLMSSPTPGLPMINQEEKASSQMSVVHQPSEPNIDQILQKVMRQYGRTFRIRREELGLTQIDVAVELSLLYGEDITMPQMSRFENFKMSLKGMCNLKLLLDRWIANIEASLRIYESLNTTDFCTPNIVNPTTARHILEKAFLQNPNPAVEEIEKLAKELTVDNESVRIWFSDRSEVLNQIQSLTACTVESAPERMKDEEDLKNFAKIFKRRRKDLGVKYEDFCKVLSKLQSERIKQGVLYRFENCEMSFSYMRKLKPILQRCLKEMEKSSNSARPVPSPLTSPAVSVSPISDCDSSISTSTVLQHISIPKDNAE